MKRLLILLVIISFTSALSAQIHVGIKGHIANTWILNKHISDAGDELDFKASVGSGFGVQGIYMVGESSGIGLGIGTSKISQQMTFNFGGDDAVYKSTMKYTDISILYTYLSESGFYLEVGPQFSPRGSEVEEIFDFKGDGEDTETFDDPNLNGMTVFGIFGIGGMIALDDQFSLLLGARFGYGLSDLTNELSEDEISDLDSDRTSFFTSVAQQSINSTTTELDYLATHPAFASFNIGIFYTLP